jgi:hypothetical protein
MGSPEFPHLLPPEDQEPPQDHSNGPSVLDHTVVKRILGSVFVVAILACAIAGLQFYGVIHVGLGRIFFGLIWVIGVSGIIFSERLWKESVFVKIFVGSLPAILLALVLIWLDGWARKHGLWSLR